MPSYGAIMRVPVVTPLWGVRGLATPEETAHRAVATIDHWVEGFILSIHDSQLIRNLINLAT
jgi:hypothetical protein